MHTIESAAKEVLSAAILGQDWCTSLEPLMEHMGALGGGPARRTATSFHAVPTSGVQNVFLAVRRGGTPPMTNQSYVFAAPTQGFVADYQVISKEARRHDPFYKDFLVGYDCVHQAAAFLDDAENGFVRLLVFRDEKRGPFETSELSAFNQSIP